MFYYFLMISEKQKEEIRQEAKRIIDNFAKSLDGVDAKTEKVKKIPGGYRGEGNGTRCDEDFRKAMFDNAPEKDKDCIIAEKKKW